MDNFDEKAIIRRICHVRKQYAGGRGKSKFARALGISPSTYSYYEDDRVPPVEILVKICEVTGADLAWLLTGRTADEVAAHGANGGLLQKVNELLSVRPELAEPILAFVELLQKKTGVEEKLVSPAMPGSSDRPGWIPVLGRTAAGMIHFWDQTSLPESKHAATELDDLVKKHLGKRIVGSVDAIISVDLRAQALMDGLKEQRANFIQVAGHEPEQIVEFVECPDVHALFPDCFALHIDGESMSPRINDGDIVIVSPSVPAAEGQIGVARVANQIGVTCKLIRSAESKVHLIPINEKYDTKVVAKKDLLWALAVLCHVSV